MPRFPFIPQRGRRLKKYPLKAAETFKSGALVLLDANEEIAECGADPTAVLGVAVHQAAGRDLLPTEQLVALGGSGRTFLGEGDNAPTEDDINQQYGVAKDANGIWHVDGTDTTNVVVEVVDVDLERGLYEFVFLVSDLQIDE